MSAHWALANSAKHCRREQDALGIEHYDVEGSGITSCPFSGLPALRAQRQPADCNGLRRWRAGAGHALEAGDDAVELAGVTRQPSEKVRKLSIMRAAARRFRQGSNRRAATHRARLCHALPGTGLRNQRRHLARGGDLLAALQRHDGTPVRPWKSSPTLVSAERVSAITAIVALTRADCRWPVQLRDLADANAV